MDLNEKKLKRKKLIKTILTFVFFLVLVVLDCVSIYSCAVATTIREQNKSSQNVKTRVNDDSASELSGNDLIAYINSPSSSSSYNFNTLKSYNASSNTIYDGASVVGYFYSDEYSVKLHCIKENNYVYNLVITSYDLLDNGYSLNIKWFSFNTMSSTPTPVSTLLFLNSDYQDWHFNYKLSTQTYDYDFLSLSGSIVNYNSSVKLYSVTYKSLSDYQLGYNTGYSTGVIDGSNQTAISKDNYYSNYYGEGGNGYNVIYQQGYNDGEESASPESFDNAFKTTAALILNSPYTVLHNVFNFEFLGINIFGLISFLITCAVILFVIKLVWR